MTLENKYNRGTHGDSSHMLSTVVLSNENQTCRGWEAPTSIGGGRMSQRASEENTKKPVKKKIAYYPRYKGKSSSIVDALKSLKINSSRKNREKIAVLNGIGNYKGSASQNTKLLNLLKKGKLIKSK